MGKMKGVRAWLLATAALVAVTGCDGLTPKTTNVDTGAPATTTAPIAEEAAAEAVPTTLPEVVLPLAKGPVPLVGTAPPATAPPTTKAPAPTTAATAKPTTTRVTAPPTTHPPTTKKAAAATTQPAEPSCTPGYDPCIPPGPDVDCAGGSGNGPRYSGPVHVTGSDPYGLDPDGDGVGCENG